MKKIIVTALALALALSFTACTKVDPVGEVEPKDEVVEEVEGTVEETEEKAEEKAEEEPKEEAAEVKVMTHAEYVAAELETPVVVETYVQGKQSWWNNKGTFYTQDEDGAYFLYELPCSEEEYNKLVPGTKIRVTGYKAEYAGEIEIIDSKFEILEGNFIAEVFDATELLGTEELINHQNEFVAFNGLTVKEINYKNGEPGDDIYLTLSLGEADYSFCVEVYLTGTESDVYKAVGELNIGDKVDVEGYLYWYNGANPHITSIKVVNE